MRPGLHALTEKERESLRLLGQGHDAKSIARHLGLSVHTIHERLRDARRKLGVSSSREAARLLLAADTATPEKVTDRELGDAAPTMLAQVQEHQIAGHSPWPRWKTGAVAMSAILAAIALATMSAPAAAPPAPAAAATESAPVTAARQFLALVDARDWDGSWNATGQAFKALNSSAKWAEVAAKVHGPLGAPSGRTLVSAEYAPAPPYGYWVVKFRSRFAGKPDTIETLSLAQEGDAWRVVGITVE
ncbi:helix-turn-helix domain-containing protein [Sandarakinorhabdus oryzae]|uniref:helix-turn-helix domain-containing protein n=1 Tax=Sandarakinorhabdus oryzae TaxID=2675220 RepID=UPI0012E20D1C|nr:DUF4019 domain-containing protein [Sandarakinorhabdus oryzae]